jgi:hypothetical protein
MGSGLSGLVDGAEEFFKDLGTMFEYLFFSFEGFFFLVFDTFSGKAYQYLGLAPYLALVPLVLIPINTLSSGLYDFIKDAFLTFGVTSSAFDAWVILSGLYWVIVSVFYAYSYSYTYGPSSETS